MILEIWLVGFILAVPFHYALSRTPQGEYFLDRVIDRGYVKSYHREKLRYVHVLFASCFWFVSVPGRLCLKWITGRWFKEILRSVKD